MARIKAPTEVDAQVAFAEAKFQTHGDWAAASVEGWDLWMSKVTRMRYAGHRASGRFFRTVSEGSARMRAWTLREVISEDRAWLKDALVESGWVISSGAELELRGPVLPKVEAKPVPVMSAPVPSIKRKMQRLIIEEHQASVELSAWDVRRAFAGIGVSIPDTVPDLEIQVQEHGGLSITWVERTERTEDAQ